jgi:hypothetical protein
LAGESEEIGDDHHPSAWKAVREYAADEQEGEQGNESSGKDVADVR